MSLETTSLRESLTEHIEGIQTVISTSKPPIVQELILAQRHLEDARMRLGVAEAYEKGFNPWKNKVEEKN